MQQPGSETLWQPCAVGTTESLLATSAASGAENPSANAQGLCKTVHRNEFGAILQRKMEEWRLEGKLKASGDGALEGSQTIHECMNTAPASESKPSVHVLHYSFKVVPGTWVPHGTTQEATAAAQRDVHMSAGEDTASQCGIDSSDQEAVSERVRTSLELLRLLHRRAEVCGRELGSTRWKSDWLTRRLSCQLNDTLAFCSTGTALPPWCIWLLYVSVCPCMMLIAHTHTPMYYTGTELPPWCT